MIFCLKGSDCDLRVFQRCAIGGGNIRPLKTLIALLVLVFTAVASGSDRKTIAPSGTKLGGNFSQGILVGGTLYISGQAGEDPAGQIPKDFEAEVTQALE